MANCELYLFVCLAVKVRMNSSIKKEAICFVILLFRMMKYVMMEVWQCMALPLPPFKLKMGPNNGGKRGSVHLD